MYLSIRLFIADADHPDASPLSPRSLDDSSVLWYKKLTKSILRQTNFEYSIALQRGHSLVLQFSVYQHDVGFSAYFSSQSEGVAMFPLLDSAEPTQSGNDRAPALQIRSLFRGAL